MIARPSPNHGPRPPGRVPDMLLLHYTGMPDRDSALARLCDPAWAVSAHYTVDEEGTIYAHVPEERRAWHAGRGCWQGDRDVNSRSIGLELVNPGHEFGYRPFPAPQIAAVIDLATGICARWAIAPAAVLGHADIAPARKEDPGELFPWPVLAAAGIGLWPEAPENPERPQETAAPVGTSALPSAATLSALLHRYGYDPQVPLSALWRAFCRHFHPEALELPLPVGDGCGAPLFPIRRTQESLRRLHSLLRLAGC